jgi:aminobenzoyl-glutamate utilization protein B
VTVDTAPIDDFVESHKDEYITLADAIWNQAELGYMEEKSSQVHIDNLEAAGFVVRQKVAGIPTAFVAEAGSGSPVIGVLGEYDALAGLSQRSLALACEPSEQVGNENGHGCGHHLLGVGSHLAAVTVKTFLDELNLSGTVRFYGCPAEEGGWGKTFLARAGAFDDLDAALTWHPSVVTAVTTHELTAVKQAYFRFTGVAAHAGVSPHLGRSALDALELMNVGVNFLREHMPPDARVHYAITDAGGAAPNVVQRSAAALYMLRSPKSSDVSKLFDRVCDIARGAALMTECGLEIEVHSGCSNLILNPTLMEVVYAKLAAIGPPLFTSQEFNFAASMQATTRPEEIEMSRHLLQNDWRDDIPLFDIVDPLDARRITILAGSSDVGDVSWVTPTVQFTTACFTFGTSPHSWQWVSQGKSSIAHEGMLLAAKTIAASAMELYEHPDLLDTARSELSQRTGGQPYRCPIPADVDPPVPLSREQST